MNQRLLSANWNELRFRAVMVCCWDTHFEWGMIKQLSAVPSQPLTVQLSERNPKLPRKTTVRGTTVLNGQHSAPFFWDASDSKEGFNTWRQRRRKNSEAGAFVFLQESPLLTCPGLELSQTITSSSVAISGGLSLTSSTWTVTGTWLRRLGLSEAEKERETKEVWALIKSNIQHCDLKLGHTVLFFSECLWVLSLGLYYKSTEGCTVKEGNVVY